MEGLKEEGGGDIGIFQRAIALVGDRGNCLVWGHQIYLSQYHVGAVKYSWPGYILQKESVCFLPQACPRPGDTWEQLVWGLMPECRVMGSWHSERNYGPGWLKVGAVVGEVLDHSKGSYLCVQRGFGSLSVLLLGMSWIWKGVAVST